MPFISRLLVFAVVIAVLALVVPQLAPGLLSFTNRQAATEASAPPATATRVEEPAKPVVQYDTRRMEGPTVQVRAALTGGRVSVVADPNGHYVVDARVNGRTFPAMVDTGATIVALTADTAARLGIYPARKDFTQAVSTANGTAYAAPVTLGELRVGGIAVRNVPAIVAPAGALEVNLLGMSFLNRLSRFEARDGALILVE